MKQIIFIDPALEDINSIISGLPPDSNYFILDPNQSGLGQMAEILAGYAQLDAIHIFSHGSPGSLQLGDSFVTQSTLDDSSAALSIIGNALASTGDILLYGCNVGQGETGRQFVNSLSHYTGSEVAASTDLTGAADRGGDWVLEASTGTIESPTLDVPGYTGTLGLTVTNNGGSSWGRSSGEYGNLYSFAALRADGSVVTWGSSSHGGDSSGVASELNGVNDVVQIFSSRYAFAALRQDGSVVTWGDSSYGGDSSGVASELNGVNDVVQIFSAGDAFAALRQDGSVVTWGSSSYGGDSGAVASELNGVNDVVQIFSTGSAFAALRQDGSVVTWGDSFPGGVSSGVASELNGGNDVVQIFSTGSAFAVLRADGSVVTWGSSYHGGDSSGVASELNGVNDVVQIFSTGSAFAALRQDGSVVTWGDSSYGGDSSAVASELNGGNDVVQIFSTVGSFAALRQDGSVVTWGYSSEGGGSSGVASELNGVNDVVQIFSTQSTFAALRQDGSVVTWGYSSYGGDSSGVASELNGGNDVVQIFSNNYAFAALRQDGSVVTWGYSPYGGDSSGVASHLNGVNDVVQIFSNNYAFAALRQDGSVVTWGNSYFGGDSSAVASEINGVNDVVWLATPFTNDVYTVGDAADNTTSDYSPGQSVIDLGSYGKLIAPVQVDGKWYCYWDRSGDGSNANTGSLNGGVDYVIHDVLDAIFTEDVNGNVNPGTDTTDTYRYATLNGVRVALPTQGDGNSNISGVYNLADNQNYTGLAEIWDTHSSGYNTAGVPSGWSAGGYWASTPSSVGHAFIALGNGSIGEYDYYDHGYDYVAVEVFGLDFPQPPVVSSPLPDQSWIEGQATTYQFSSTAFTDPDGQALTYSATTSTGAPLPSWLSFNPSTRTFSGTPAIDSSDVIVRVTANDGYSGTVTDDFVITTVLADATAPGTGILSVLLAGSEWMEQGGSTFTSTGDATIGLAGGSASILSVSDGTYVLDADNLTIAGTFTSIIDGVSRPLFTGQVALSLAEANGAIDWATTLYEAAGLKPTFTSLSLANNDLRLQYDTLGLPAELSLSQVSLAADTLVINSTGPSLGVSGSVGFPDLSFDLFNILSIETTDWSASYDAVADQLAILGGFELQPGWPVLPAISAELTGDGLIIKDGAVVDVALEVNLEDFAIKGWGFQDIGFSLDTDANNFTGQGKLSLPIAQGYSVSASLGFTLSPFELDSASLIVPLPAPGIPVFSTGWFISSLGGGVSNLASAVNAPVLFSGAVGLDGPKKLVEMELTGKLDINHATGSVTGHVIDENLIQFNGEATLDWNQEYVKLAANAEFFDGVITGDFNFQSDFDLNFSARGSAQVEILKQKLAGDYYLLFSNDDNFSNDYVAGWATAQVSLPFHGSVSLTKGIKYTFDGKLSTFGANDVPLYKSWIVDEAIADLTVTVGWENAAISPVQTRVIVYDDLDKTQVREIIDEADYAAHNIAVVDGWSSDYAKVVYILAPDPGVWDVEVVNATGLGAITSSAVTSRAEGSLAVDGVSIDNNLVTLNYSAIDSKGDSNLYFFADKDNGGYDGILIGSALESDSSSQFIWDANSFEAGHYWLYATMEDGVSVPISFYAPQAVEIIQPNRVPLLYYPTADQTTTAGTAFSLQIPANSFVDLDAEDSLTFAATLPNGDPLPGWLAFDPTTLTFSGTPGNGDIGVLDIQVTAGDTSAATVSDTFLLTVANDNLGNDFYFVNSPQESIAEAVDGGIDVVLAASSFTLPENVENLLLGGTVVVPCSGHGFGGHREYTTVDLSLNGSGNEGNNLLVGNRAFNRLDGLGGDDRLVGGKGSDTLTGGDGSDIFVLGPDHKAGIGAVDTITDFADGIDQLDLMGGLTFADLVIGQGNGSDTALVNTVISATNGDYLAVLLNTNASTITQADFYLLTA